MPSSKQKSGFILLIFSFAFAASTEAAIYSTVPNALKKAFPEATDFSNRRVFLSKAQTALAKKNAGGRVNFKASIVTQFTAKSDGVVSGFAYLDTHLVRTLPETLLVAMNSKGQIITIEVISFKEPPEYMAPGKWKDQFKGKNLSPKLSLKGEIHGITGATLTAQSFEESVRRVLSIHKVLQDTK